jgi:ferredoxin-thioredoxin reductase catalytic chain
MSKEITIDDTKKFVQQVAQRNGWVLNKDTDFLESIIEGLLGNAQRLGYYQCPCRLSWDIRDKDKDILCPCVYAKADIEEYGHCFCALYQSPEFAASGEEPGSIPERRPQELFPE